MIGIGLLGGISIAAMTALGDGGPAPQIPERFVMVTGGQSLAEYPFQRGAPRVARKMVEWLRQDFGYATTGTINAYNTHGSNSTWHDGSTAAATDFKIKLINKSSGGSALCDIAQTGSQISAGNYWWNTQPNPTSPFYPEFDNAADTPGPLLRAFIATLTIEEVIHAINWSQGTTDMGVPKALYKATGIKVFAAMRAARPDLTIPIFIHRHGRHQTATDLGSQEIRDVQSEWAAELSNVHIAAEEYDGRFAVAAQVSGASITENSNLVGFADTTGWQMGMGFANAAFAVGSYISALTATQLTISIRDAKGNQVASNAAPGSTNANATVHRMDSVHLYPGSDGVEPQDGPGGTQHIDTQGFYAVARRVSRSVARHFGSPTILYNRGPKLSLAAGAFGAQSIDIDIIHDGGTDFTSGDVTGWRVERNGVPIVIDSIVKDSPTKVRIVPVAALLEGSYSIWYAYGSIGKANPANFIYDNASPLAMPMQPTSPIPLPLIIPAPATDPDVAAIFNACTTPPTTQRQTLINNLVAYLKATTVWSQLDMLMMFWAADAQAARIDWKMPSIVGTQNGTLTFTADRGFTGSAGWIGTGYNPSAASRGLTLNDAHFGIYGLTSSSSANADMCSGNDRLRLRTRASSSAFVRINSSTQTTLPTDTFGNATHLVGMRRDAVNQLGFRQGALRVNAAGASLGLPGEIEVGRQAGGATYSDRQWGAVHAGRALTDQQVMDLFTGLRNYGVAVGALAA